MLGRLGRIKLGSPGVELRAKREGAAWRLVGLASLAAGWSSGQWGQMA